MASDLEAQLDALRAQVQALAATVATLAGRANQVPPAQQDTNQLLGHMSEPMRQIAEELAAAARGGDVTGIVSSSGYWKASSAAGSSEAIWVDERRTADELLDQDDRQVARVLAALAHKQRLAIIKALLVRPMTASELTERLGMGTSGQVYHHLNALQSADLVVPADRAQFRLRFGRVFALLMLLAAVKDLLPSADAPRMGNE